MNITYQNFATEDIDSIIQFWNENSGWETNMNREEFNLRFCTSPFGRPIIMLALKDKELVGLFCFLAVNVTINGKELKSYRSFGAVLKESFREEFGIYSFLTGKHPLLKLYNKGIEVAKKENAAISYNIPDPRWGKILKAFPFETCKYPLWSYKVASNEPFDLGCNTEIRNIDSTDRNIQVLWEQSHKTNLCTITKNSNFYHSKLKASRYRYKFRAIYRNNELIGLFTLDNKGGGAQWLICDLLTLDQDEVLTLTLKAACNAIQLELLKTKLELRDTFKAAILATPTIEQKVKTLGFYRDNYDFVFAVQVLDKALPKNDIDFDNWYVSAND
jgi:hypothetical protein